MNLRITFIAAVGALLSGCVTLQPEVAFEGLSLVRAEPADIVAQYSLPGRKDPELPLTGKLRLDFATDTDFIELLEDDGLNLWSEVEICESKVEITRWSYIYQNGTIPLDQQGKIHHYSVFLRPSWRGPNYDLEQWPESICLVFGAGQMGRFFDYRSNTLVVDREQVIRAFEGGQ